MNRYSYPTFKRPPYIDGPFQIGEKVRFTTIGLERVNKADKERVSGIGTLLSIGKSSTSSPICAVLFDKQELVPIQYLERA
jgi:hypothetical protein